MPEFEIKQFSLRVGSVLQRRLIRHVMIGEEAGRPSPPYTMHYLLTEPRGK
jgi:hypothetical protein